MERGSCREGAVGDSGGTALVACESPGRTSRRVCRARLPSVREVLPSRRLIEPRRPTDALPNTLLSRVSSGRKQADSFQGPVVLHAHRGNAQNYGRRASFQDSSQILRRAPDRATKVGSSLRSNRGWTPPASGQGRQRCSEGTAR